MFTELYPLSYLRVHCELDLVGGLRASMSKHITVLVFFNDFFTG